MTMNFLEYEKESELEGFIEEFEIESYVYQEPKSNKRSDYKKYTIKEQEDLKKILKDFSTDLFPKYFFNGIKNIKKDNLFEIITNYSQIYNKLPPRRIHKRNKKALYAYTFHTFKGILF